MAQSKRKNKMSEQDDKIKKLDRVILLSVTLIIFGIIIFIGGLK